MKHINEVYGKDISVTLNKHKTGISTGLHALDSVYLGFRPSDLIIVAGAPAMGKTTLAISIVLHTTTKEKIPTLYCSDEHEISTLNRIVGAKADFILHETVNDEEGVLNAAHVLKNSPLFIENGSFTPFVELEKSIISAKEGKGVKLVIIDTPKSRYSCFDCKRLKELATILDISIILVYQIDIFDLSNRVGYEGKCPYLMDLGEDTSIINWADTFMFLHTPAYYGYEETLENVSTKLLVNILPIKMSGIHTTYNSFTSGQQVSVYYNERYNNFIP